MPWHALTAARPCTPARSAPHRPRRPTLSPHRCGPLASYRCSPIVPDVRSSGMRLTKLELSGFKSFADSTQLVFDTGVTAIVGPNGCGKSNVSDAVRWVLGEQRVRALRGAKMDEVIFQGSSARRAVNAAGGLQIPFREVVITRRLNRSGDSEYFINRSACRLRDVQDLLRGTGLGADASVIIESKMIDALLSDRPDE